MDAQKKRSFTIPRFKNPVEVNSAYADRALEVLEQAITKIYHHNTEGLILEVLCRNAYNMVMYGYGERLYSGVVNIMMKHLKETSKSIEAIQPGKGKSFQVPQGDIFLVELNRKWNMHTMALQMIQNILMHMDWTFVPCHHKTPVYELGMNLWRDNIIRSSNIQGRFCNTVMDLIHKERTGEVINRWLMRNIIDMLMHLGPSVYQEDFEKPFLDVSISFYSVESQKFIECCDCGEYLKKAELRLQEENERVCHYLDVRTKPKIKHVVEKEMIRRHMKRLIHMDSGLVNMLINDKYEDLGRMYKLFCQVPDGLSTIRDIMTSHLRETGKQIVNNPERLKDPVDFVQQLLNEKDKYDKIIGAAFSNDKSFQKVMDSSFEYFMNLNNRSPEFISLYLDDKFRKGMKDVSEEDVDIFLDKVMMLFDYLQEKDVFEKYYRQHLAKRLLSGRSASDDAEISLIVKLKKCGHLFTSKLETMLKDMKTSQDIMQDFYASQSSEIGDCPTLTVKALTMSSWPTQPSPTCNLPSEILLVCQKFRSYYLGIHSSRRLTWQCNMGTADLKAYFGKGRKHKLTVSTYQMCVLMLFNSREALSCKEIERATGIPLPDLKRGLQSLACVLGKNVLCKDPVSNDITDGDIFSVNDKFSSKFFKVKIDTVASDKASEPEKLEIRQRVENDRIPQLDAAIIRIMKAKKVSDHNTLVTEVTKQLQLHLPTPIAIKKRIESLIDREFLERDTTDRTLYHYLA